MTSHVQLADLFRPLAPLHLVLHHHRVDAIVDAEISGARPAKRRLQTIEDPRYRHIQPRRLVTVDLERQLRHVATPGGKHLAQLRMLVRHPQHLPRYLLQLG